MGLSIGLLLLIALGVAARRGSQSEASLPCAASEIHLDPAGIARCGPGKALSTAQLLTVGGKIDLNSATESDLVLAPGIGPHLARALSRERARLGRFATWEQVDRVPGVGASKLSAIQEIAEIR